ncbi:uncharacterized protein CPUR_06815 [Claviceps purpurea 20.1]|uniref:Uncharacterized protein n=1 Tax=Claviceps purpurea (strain 20.1) TaxID=1111077 RepID=M1W7J6_CLAP2|nr:uncharacterized protein CPUR_06815 [Claviceps purpurea 20.1]
MRRAKSLAMYLEPPVPLEDAVFEYARGIFVCSRDIVVVEGVGKRIRDD